MPGVPWLPESWSTGRISSLTEYWYVLQVPLRVWMSVGTISMKYWYFIWLAVVANFSSPSRGWMMLPWGSPKLNLSILCVKLASLSSNNVARWAWPRIKGTDFPAAMWKFPATLFNVKDPWTRQASNGSSGFCRLKQKKNKCAYILGLKGSWFFQKIGDTTRPTLI